MMGLQLRDRVILCPRHGFRVGGQVRGLTLEANPRYDILDDEGNWHIAVPADEVEADWQRGAASAMGGEDG